MFWSTLQLIKRAVFGLFSFPFSRPHVSLYIDFNDVFAHVQEMILLEADAVIYKLIGPVLVKQDVEEAKLTVDKRISYITEEMWVCVDTAIYVSLSPSSSFPPLLPVAYFPPIASATRLK